MKPVDVLVVGAGASGMASAIAAARTGAEVVLLEGAPKAGRSVMASGNGRCNFANADLSPERYNDPAFVAAVMGSEPLDPILQMFGALGLWYVCDDEGRLFPRSRSAASVLDVLLRGLAWGGVDLRLQSRATAVEGCKDGWRVKLEGGADILARTLVWAAGGGSAEAPSLGAGLPRTNERPALCPLATDPRPGKALDGVRTSCAVELRSGRASVARREGEVLFRPYGLSGIAVFDLSRLARPGDALVLDLLPDVSEDDLASLIAERSRCFDALGPAGAPREPLTFLDGACHPKIGRHVMESLRGSTDPRAVARALKNWPFTVVGTADETHAQVTQGGLATAAFDPATLEARCAPGFFSCGEALDVDGECGGLNLAWAWSSGMVAGVAAARRARHC